MMQKNYFNQYLYHKKKKNFTYLKQDTFEKQNLFSENISWIKLLFSCFNQKSYKI